VLTQWLPQYFNIATSKIAQESRNDSTAMKTIAVLTTVFLPGTFTAVGSLSWLLSSFMTV
jgi:hypothetical protein